MSSAYQVLKRFRFGLEAKFVVLSTVVIIAGTAVGNWLIFAYEEEQLIEQARSKTRVLAESMALSFTHTLIYEELGLVEEAGLLDLFIEEVMVREDMQVRFVKVLDLQGRVIAHSDYQQFGRPDLEFQRRYGNRLRGTRVSQRRFREESVIEVATPLSVSSQSAKSWGTLVLAVSLKSVEEELGIFATRLYFLALVAIAAGIALAFLIAGTLARPIKRLAIAMSQVGPGLETGLRVDRRDEIGLLQSSFLEMLRRLDAVQEDRERAHDAVLRAQKLASIGSLAAGVAHEINNPLGGMKNCLVQLEAHPEEQERFQLYIGLMHRAVDRISQVVRGLLDFSRRRDLRIEPVVLMEVVQKALPLVAYRLEKNGIDLDLDLDPDLPLLMGDGHQLEQVLINLILNGVDVMEEGGRLGIRSFQRENSLIVQIRDTGPGISEEMQARIFDPFFTTKEVGSGTGLGLTVSLNIIREHGGDLSFANASDGGAVFSIALPVQTAGTLAAKERAQ